MNKNNVIPLPKYMPTELEKAMLEQAIGCNNCGNKLFYILNYSVVCYKCKSAFNLEK